ncbi:hypothetical protein V6Z12_D13G201500 [Gossypium hirsutum]
MKGIRSILIALGLFDFACSSASAYDPSPLQDFCVAIKDTNNGVFVNGKFCKGPKLAVAEDFFFSGLNRPGNTSNPVGSNVTIINVDQIPELNSLGISLVGIDYAPYGVNPPPVPTLTLGDPRSCLLSTAHFMSASLQRTQTTVSSLKS